MTKEKIEEILKHIKSNLNIYKSDTITLRRAFSKNVDAINTKTKFAYLEVTNGIEYFDYLSKNNFFIVTLFAKQLDFNSSVKMEDYLHSLYHGETNVSTKKRISKLLEENKKTDNLLRELSWFVKKANHDGTRINEYSLYADLLDWKHSAYSWARKIVRKGENKNNA